MYRTLKQLGKRGIKEVKKTNTITKEAFKDHFSKVSAERFENPPEEIEKAVEGAEDRWMEATPEYATRKGGDKKGNESYEGWSTRRRWGKNKVHLKWR